MNKITDNYKLSGHDSSVREMPARTIIRTHTHNCTIINTPREFCVRRQRDITHCIWVNQKKYSFGAADFAQQLRYYTIRLYATTICCKQACLPGARVARDVPASLPGVRPDAVGKTFWLPCGSCARCALWRVLHGNVRGGTHALRRIGIDRCAHGDVCARSVLCLVVAMSQPSFVCVRCGRDGVGVLGSFKLGDTFLVQTSNTLGCGSILWAFCFERTFVVQPRANCEMVVTVWPAELCGFERKCIWLYEWKLLKINSLQLKVYLSE